MTHNHIVVRTASGGLFKRTGEVADTEVAALLKRLRWYYGTVQIRLHPAGTPYRYQQRPGKRYQPVLRDADGEAIWTGAAVGSDDLPGLVPYLQAEYENMTVEVERCDEDHVWRSALYGSRSVKTVSGGLPTLGRRRR